MYILIYRCVLILLFHFFSIQVFVYTYIYMQNYIRTCRYLHVSVDERFIL